MPTPQARGIATQLIHNAIKQIDSETACDHITDTLGEDIDVDALAFASEAAVRTAQIVIRWGGDKAAEASRLIQVELLAERARDHGNSTVDVFLLLDALGLET